MSRAEVIALFGPTGVGKTGVAIELARGLRDLGERPVAVSADALQVYQGLEALTGAARARRRARRARAPADLGDPGRRVIQRRPVCGARARGGRCGARRRAAPDRR